VLLQLRGTTKCQCRPCVLQDPAGGQADAFAIVPYVPPCDNGVSQDCMCCNVLRIVSYEFVFMVSSSLCKTSYGINFLWNSVFRMLS
jgi:hypothetical protein